MITEIIEICDNNVMSTVVIFSIVIMVWSYVQIFRIHKSIKLQKHTELLKNQMLVIVKAQQKHDNWHSVNKNISINIYKNLTGAYDYELNYYSVKKGELSRFLYRKLKLIKELTECLCHIDYFNVNFKDVNDRIEDTREKIYFYAEKISVDFAQENKKRNTDIFSKNRYQVNEILNDNVKNDKSNRLLKLMKETVSDSTRVSIETYFDIKKRPKKDKFTQLMKDNSFHEAACELLMNGKYVKQIISVIGIIENLSEQEISKKINYETINIEKNKIRKSLFELYEKIKRV